MNPQNSHTTPPDVERLKQVLLENGETVVDAESLANVAHFLRQLPAPEANVLKQRQLLERLAVHLPRGKSRIERLREWYPVAVLLSQTHIVRSDIWLASTLVMLLGALITLGAPSTLLLTALAPIVTAAGVSLIYDQETILMLELESSTRTSVALLLLARLTLVFGFDLLLALAGSIVLAWLRADLLLYPLILSWLGPMAFLSALAFFLSIWLADTFAAGSFSLGLWALHLVLSHVKDSLPVLQFLSWPGLSDPANRLLLFGAAGLLILTALLMVGRLERRPATSE